MKGSTTARATALFTVPPVERTLTVPDEIGCVWSNWLYRAALSMNGRISMTQLS